MKDWQYGIPIEDLKEIEAFFDLHHNKWSLGPFSKFDNPKIAKALHDKTLIERAIFGQGVCIVNCTRTKVKTPIKSFGYTIAEKAVGDYTFDPFAVDDGMEPIFKNLASQNWNNDLWAMCFVENRRQVQMLLDAGFVKIGTKFTSMAEIIGVYFKGEQHTLLDDNSGMPWYEDLNIVELPKMSEFSLALALAVKAKTFDWKIHYSNYNKDKSWSALSLRGFSDDPLMIEKPAEMTGKHKAKYEGKSYTLQDTPLRKELPEVESVLAYFPKHTKFERIRLMRLEPGGGELQRHTDQTDKSLGMIDGKIMRFHFPLITNPGVMFTSWNANGDSVKVNMQVDFCYLLDIRKPHQAINNGPSERIHLVVDVVASEAIRSMLR